MTRKSWFRYFQYDEGKESPADARNVLLIVAGLIAAVTFQAGVTPPGGVWQDDKDGHRPGRAIYSYQTKEFYVFLISNTDELVKFRYILFAAAAPFIIRFLLQVWARLTMEEQPYEKHIVFPDNRSGENELNRV
ncbi:uncharacterized protein LOC117931724 isoform X2 [Vitis riparia]|uniref:uncharacterized protein LOC117931724 isoform X2 n=1 Tax=Vitis riparia TaxID=96939 RepID=UPI00155A9B90|nr:uncharacterized protein LOC117931724 isoform X2 [Vitis riparia]